MIFRLNFQENTGEYQMYKTIMRESIPCWYELEWDVDKLAIVFKLHKRAILNNDLLVDGHVQAKAPIVRILKNAFNFKSFYGGFDKDFGFNSALKLVGEENDFVIFKAELPNTRKVTNENCWLCNSTGISTIDESEKCSACGGNGKGCCLESFLLTPISASFSVLFSLFDEFIDYDTGCDYSQLMTVWLQSSKRRQYGFPVGGKFGMDLTNWMSSFTPRYEIIEMSDAMKYAYWQMIGLRTDKYTRFRASIDYENGWLNVEVPGDACGMNPSHGSVVAGEGYEFAPHNTDTVFQQLALLAGLATLHDRAKIEICK